LGELTAFPLTGLRGPTSKVRAGEGRIYRGKERMGRGGKPRGGNG